MLLIAHSDLINALCDVLIAFCDYICSLWCMQSVPLYVYLFLNYI